MTRPEPIDPIGRFLRDRQRAMSLGDPRASLCVVASVRSDGIPSARTLVIRVIEERLGIFVNATSPKYREFSASQTVSAIAYFPSISVQYRFTAALRKMESALVHSFWQNRPAASKRLEALYDRHPQSSVVESAEYLIRSVSELDVPKEAPPSAVGFFFDPYRSIERLELDNSSGIHERQLYSLTEGSWTVARLVP